MNATEKAGQARNRNISHPSDVVEDVPNEETSPDKKGQEQNDNLARPDMSGIKGLPPEKPIGGQKPQRETDQMFFHLEGPDSGAQANIFAMSN